MDSNRAGPVRADEDRRVRVGTPLPKAGNKVEYKTEDGKRWSVGYVKNADGTYRYQTPEEVK
jgi:hypothetical protein